MRPIKTAKKTMFVLGGVLLISAGFSSETQAACYFLSGSSEIRSSFNMGTITVQRDTPVGTVLVEKNVAQSPGTPSYACSAGVSFQTGYGELRFATLSAYGNGVYDTNIEGIGIRMYVLGYNGGPGTLTIPYTNTFIPKSGTTYYYGHGKRVQLVKTSSNAVGAGALTTGTLSRASAFQSSRLYTATLTLTGGTIVRAACTITNTSIQVPLGDTMRTDFTGVGSTGKQVPFNIPLNCNANTNVKVTLDGTAAPGGAKGVVVLSSSSSETVTTGVGVQMLYKNTPVTLGSAITVGTASSGVYNIPLVGRYYQTQANVTSGKANAMATFTMTYN